MKHTFLMLTGIALFFIGCKQAPNMITEEVATDIELENYSEDNIYPTSENENQERKQ